MVMGRDGVSRKIGKDWGFGKQGAMKTLHR
jgi:hypothetical protein